ncbi:agmatinase [Rhizohabitans arisaemae]|uniref:agmatinase n=1 Tax=Rhizohabitans arisaemae TaxID=2720610 RepID=UPI0024B0DE6C|nr:agmatinase [Rhizohabitans arisaemae]
MRMKTFHGVPESDDGRIQGRSTDIAILGAPIDLGAADRPGARFGPDAIRNAPYLSGEIFHIPLETQVFAHTAVVDVGDCDVSIASHVQSIDNLRKKAREVVSNTGCLVTLGGDNSVVLPVMEAVAERHGPVAFVHFDAHTDTWGERTPKLTHATVVRRAVEQGLIRRGHQIGIRGYGPFGEVLRWGEENGLTVWSMDTIEELGFNEVIQSVLMQVTGPVYLSIDIDALDPAYAPGTGTPEPGGLTSRELLSAVRILARNLDVVGFDVVEVSPPYDQSEITAIVANRCVMELLSAKTHRARNER